MTLFSQDAEEALRERIREQKMAELERIAAGAMIRKTRPTLRKRVWDWLRGKR